MFSGRIKLWFKEMLLNERHAALQRFQEHEQQVHQQRLHQQQVIAAMRTPQQQLPQNVMVNQMMPNLPAQPVSHQNIPYQMPTMHQGMTTSITGTHGQAQISGQNQVPSQPPNWNQYYGHQNNMPMLPQSLAGTFCYIRILTEPIS